MNLAIIQELIGKALAKEITFREILATLGKEGVESYHVDFLRNEFRYYATNGESLATSAALLHDRVAADFSAEKIEGINQRVQAGQAAYPDFVREGTAAGCAYYIVYLNGKKVRYFGRDGGEYVQHFPGSR
ncbi:MAG: DUF1398 family protein [Candidatus Acidiferrales bacterium]